MIFIGFGGSLRKGLFSRLVKRQGYHIFRIPHGILLASRPGALHFRSGENDGTVRLQFFNRLHQLILGKDIPLVVDPVAQLVVVISLAVRLCYKIETAGLTQLLQNGIGVGNAGNLNIDPVASLLIHLRLCAVTVHTLLQLIDGVVHILRAGILVPHYLIGNDPDQA